MLKKDQRPQYNQGDLVHNAFERLSGRGKICLWRLRLWLGATSSSCFEPWLRTGPQNNAQGGWLLSGRHFVLVICLWILLETQQLSWKITEEIGKQPIFSGRLHLGPEFEWFSLSWLRAISSCLEPVIIEKVFGFGDHITSFTFARFFLTKIFAFSSSSSYHYYYHHHHYNSRLMIIFRPETWFRASQSRKGGRVLWPVSLKTSGREVNILRAAFEKRWVSGVLDKVCWDWRTWSLLS